MLCYRNTIVSDMLQKRYILLLAQGKFEYGMQEMETIAKIIGFNFHEKVLKSEGLNYQHTFPICVLHSVCEKKIRQLMSRSVLCKAAFELWGCGVNYQTLKTSVLEYPTEFKTQFYEEEKTFAIRVKGVGKKVSKVKQIEKITQLEDAIFFKGKVKLEKPDEEYFIIENYTTNMNEQPVCIYFGRFLCHGQRKLLETYSIKGRKFIGNTTMDPMLGFAMANFACARPGSLVCDPFVGTGSLLISSAHFGSHVVGGDICYNILHGRGKSSRKGAGWRKRDETIRHSLQDYGLGAFFIDTLVTDASKHAWKTSSEIFDAIITDPPYGIREACMRVGSKRPIDKVVIPTLLDGQVHFPEQTAYHLDDVFKDLLTFAAHLLVQGGRLVYWLPVYRSDYSPDVIPRHPALKLVYNCEQVLNRHSSRRLIVMEKCDSNFIKNNAFITSSMFSGHNSFRNKYYKAA